MNIGQGELLLEGKIKATDGGLQDTDTAALQAPFDRPLEAMLLVQGPLVIVFVLTDVPPHQPTPPWRGPPQAGCGTKWSNGGGSRNPGTAVAQRPVCRISRSVTW
ncbi:MAG: hypothetical protein K6E22_04100 [Treponema sp.]|nr:hypothetical protein [Treponema sp.]